MLQSVQNRVNEERGSGGDQVGEEADGSYTGSAEFVVASLVAVTSVLTHALDKQQPLMHRSRDLLGRRLWTA